MDQVTRVDQVKRAVVEAMRGVVDPELGDDIVDLGMLQEVEVRPAGHVVVKVALTVAGCPLRGQIDRDIQSRALAVAGVETVEVVMGEMGPEARSALMDRARWKASQAATATEVQARTTALAFASGKGGVGKSSVTVNVACALAERGLTVGLLDADIWGFSVPRMLSMEGRLPGVKAERGPKMAPLVKRVGPGAVKVVSMGFLSGEDTAIMWRGLMLSRALQHFLEDVRWGDIDYLLIDMPPGTGDVQMGLARMLPRTQMIIITTPALAAQKVAARAADMARRGYLRIAGIIENMSAFACEHGSSYPLFGEGGGTRLAAEIGVPLIGSVPLDPSVSRGGDLGEPAVLSGPGPVRQAFAGIAERLTSDVTPLLEMSSCSARLVEEMGRVSRVRQSRAG
ncbi:MAG: P-loop NTPase [Acidimicrobiales bacterium]